MSYKSNGIKKLATKFIAKIGRNEENEFYQKYKDSKKNKETALS